MNFLKRHPFAVEAFFDSSVVLTFAVLKEELESYIPECLTLDTFQDKWAFVAVAMVQTKGLRPKGFPQFMSDNFFLIGYRIFVRYTTVSGKRQRGLYIIKSETNKRKMTFWGNVFTHYNYTTTDITHTTKDNFRTIKSNKSKFHLTIEEVDTEIDLPKDSPFENWKEARRFAGPLPFTYTYEEDQKQILIIEGVRTNWKPKPIKISNYDFDYLDTLKFKNIVLANSFEITNIPYYWKKGRIEKWK